ncbi:hypothetical protein SAMN06264364_11593 [Quadrisphaera granulorum]|uniref:Ribbon-helix-helix CopG family protein n=1 Tax=Quadrisphaera granulorum TaxID=317664 RepID=A0A316A5W3_9ACTN|nr:hypothetical protein [Quadrisphaera granulorum]PWJ53075.1 hypothetical protein BXY45_11593 [Quadrisphaera granulorum]SZE97240.1 hypothetical protein SAMN06264364_11593 [Quadrisphaera granulorum]
MNNINIRTTDGRSLEVDRVEDLDLDLTPVTLESGRHLDEHGAEDLVTELLETAGRPLPAHLRPVGRPPLSGVPGESSARIAFRASPDLRDRAEQEARRRGMKVSQLAREALTSYLAHHH